MAKARFTNSVAFWTKRSEQQRATAAASQARPLNSRPVVNAAGSGSVPGTNRLVPAGYTGATTNPGLPSVLVDPPMKMFRPEIVEDEPTKRRRNLRDFMGEWAPGIELELGVTDVRFPSPRMDESC